MIYPGQPELVPVFAVELIVFGQLPRVAVIDLQPAAGLDNGPLRAEVDQHLQTVWMRYQGRLSHGGELPSWAEQHFTRYCIYARPQTLQQLPHVILAFRAYFRVWRDHFLVREDGLVGENLSALTQYQSHHVENTPGRKFLHTSFGLDWTESYLRNFMYPAGL